MQTVLPVEQSVRPVLHGALGFDEHGWFATHAPQLPFESHTWPEPQFVPGALLLPSTHRCAPVLHSVMPLRQPGLGFIVQATLAEQLTHAPVALQTWFVPHEVPAARLPESTQVCAPVVHDVRPVLQPGFGLVVHAVDATHATQLPLALQTWSGPHEVPGVTFVESTHRVAPVLQSMTPLLQGAPGFDVQALPAVHMPQKPFASQTCPAPQLVPAAFGAPSTHACAPVAHEKTPCRHAEPGLVVHAPPAVHATHIPVAVQT
ncbi:MAG: hypothetical protein GQE15_29785 [Archangiaceae bacterium]|nr:hypothetical protein [Archangiaceae bacterium]